MNLLKNAETLKCLTSCRFQEKIETQLRFHRKMIGNQISTSEVGMGEEIDFFGNAFLNSVDTRKRILRVKQF